MPISSRESIRETQRMLCTTFRYRRSSNPPTHKSIKRALLLGNTAYRGAHASVAGVLSKTANSDYWKKIYSSSPFILHF